MQHGAIEWFLFCSNRTNLSRDIAEKKMSMKDLNLDLYQQGENWYDIFLVDKKWIECGTPKHLRLIPLDSPLNSVQVFYKLQRIVTI